MKYLIDILYPFPIPHLAYHAIILFCAFILDAIIGDPNWLPHPVRMIGKAIILLEHLLYRDTDDHKRQFFKGMLLTLIIIIVSFSLSTLVLFLCYSLNDIAGVIASIIMSTYFLAANDLKKSAMKVYRCLTKNDLPSARKAVAMIVGRDTENLSEQGVIKATIESVSESISDGVIAPAFYLFLFGVFGGVIYKSVNTLDSMIGYKNDRYLYFGKFAAHTDDVLNFIPSRISAFLVIFAAPLLNCDFKHGVIIWRRDRKKHSSPNSAQPESAMAGILGIRLGGPASYFGKIIEKPYLGDIKRDIVTDDIKKSCQIMYLSSFLFILIVLVTTVMIAVVSF
ncbi:MAG: adenosylcobinamide-phosphate synthase CbiB [Lachnospiraceae bacterium]|nr:adenosylcobinamide-phosphate synthase CbiB [Lachnospiraceae bacterium]